MGISMIQVYTAQLRQIHTHTHTQKDPNELMATESGLNEQNRLEII